MFLAYLVMHWGTLVVLAAARPMAVRAPHAGSRRELKQTAFGDRLSYRADHSAAVCGLQRTVF